MRGLAIFASRLDGVSEGPTINGSQLVTFSVNVPSFQRFDLRFQLRDFSLVGILGCLCS